MTPYYQDEWTTIYHGDCRTILEDVGDVDLVLMDPPYGINHKSHGMIFAGADKIQGDQDADTATGLTDDVLEWCGGRPVAMFFSPYRPLSGKWRNILCWNKGAHVGIGGDRKTCWKRTIEMIAIRNNRPLNGKRDGAVLDFPALLPPPSGHFCEKPLALMSYLVKKLTQPGDTIIDPFMGSGSTLRAAKDIGRKAIGIELEEKWCEAAAKRLAQGVLW